MTKTRWLTWGLFLIICFVGIRVEWLNAHSGFKLPIWKSAGEEGFDMSQKLRSSILAFDSFWNVPESAEKLKPKNRSKLQKEAQYWNRLLEFKWFALLQFPFLLVQGLLLVWWRYQKLTSRGNLLWWCGCCATVLLLASALYRDYSYGIYGL